MSKVVTPVRIWAVVALVVGVIAIALIGVVIHLKTSEPSCAAELNIPDWEKYAWLFRTEAEQREIELQLKSSPILHGCCNSPMANCNTCTCEQEYGYFTAHVRYPAPSNVVNISQIKLLACCHCINK